MLLPGAPPLPRAGVRSYDAPMTQTPPDLPMRALFDAQFQASRAQIDVPLSLRLDRLRRIRALIDVHLSLIHI